MRASRLVLSTHNTAPRNPNPKDKQISLEARTETRLVSIHSPTTTLLPSFTSSSTFFKHFCLVPNSS